MSARLGCALLMATLAFGGDLYRVAGVVVNAQTGSPIPGARAIIEGGTSSVIARQVAGSDGRFSFYLPQGNFRLIGGTREFMQMYGEPAPGVAVGSAVITGPGHDTSDLVLHWFPPAAISGKVVDENGDPVENALVQLVRAGVAAGRRTTTTVGWTRTDDRGEYRSGRISGGTYYLAVTATPWYAERALFGSKDANASAAYAPVYYPNVTEGSRAQPLHLAPGEEAHADFILHTAAGASITVTYDGQPPLSGLLSLIQEGIAGTDGFQRQDRIAARQVLRGVPPGRYLLRANSTRGTAILSAQQWVEVNGVDQDVKLTMHHAPTVSGTVRWTNPAGKPPGATLIMLIPEKQSTIGVTVSVAADGSFTFPSILAGSYRPAVRVGIYSFDAEVQAEGAAFRSGVLELAEDETATLRISANGNVGTVKGVVARGGKAVEGVMVVLAPVRDTANWAAYRGFQTDSDGSYNFEDVNAGEYYLFAMDDPEVEYTNPEIARTYYPNARRVRAEAGKEIELNIEPVRAAGK